MTTTSIVKEVELDFAEFASTLISETLKAVISSILTQERQVAELEQQAMLTPEEYANEQLTDELIRAEIMRLFPSNDGVANESSVDVGEPYTLSVAAGEFPSIRKKVGYTIIDGDLNFFKDLSVSTVNEMLDNNSVPHGLAVISETGYNHIYSATRLMLAIQHLAVLRQTIKRGIPRVYVNDGYIKSKLMLKLESQVSEEQTPTDAQTAPSSPVLLRSRRLIAQPVSTTRTEFLTLSADILSEVEISFKTVVP